MARTSCRTAATLIRTRRRQLPRGERPTRNPSRSRTQARGTPVLASQGRLPNESIAPLYSSPGGHVTVDVWRAAGGNCCIPATARLCVAGSGLPNDSSDDVLPRRRPHGDGVISDGAARTTVRAGSRIESDDVVKFALQLNHY